MHDRVLINRFFFDVQKPEGLAALRGDREACLERYAFSPELRAAIEHADIAAMYRAGANPYLLRFYCVNMGVPEPKYLEALHSMQAAQASVTVGGKGGPLPDARKGRSTAGEGPDG